MALQKSLTIGLEQYWQVLKRRWLPITAVFLTISSFGIVQAYLEKPRYLASGIIRVKIPTFTANLTELGKEVEDLRFSEGNILLSEAEIIASTPVITQTLNQLGWRDEEGEPLSHRDFQDDLSVTEVTETDMLEVGLEHESPRKAAEAVNTLMQIYIAESTQAAQEEAIAAGQFIDEQVPKAEQAVRSAEARLRQFQQANQIADLSTLVTGSSEKVLDLKSQIADAQAKLSETEAQSSAIQGRLGLDPQEAIALTSLNQSVEVKGLLDELQKTEALLAAEKERLTGEHPIIADLEGKSQQIRGNLKKAFQGKMGAQSSSVDSSVLISALKQDLTAELVNLETNRQGLVQRIATLSQSLSALQQQNNRFPALELQYRELTRRVEGAQSIYASLLQKQQEIRVAENEKTPKARIVSLADVPDEPLTSKRSAYLAAGLMGLLGAIAVAILLETLDKSVKTAGAAIAQLDFPIVGFLPEHHASLGMKSLLYDGDSQRLIPSVFIRDNPASGTAQSYRFLQLKLKELEQNQPLKVIVFTSSSEREGKSTIVANLAAAAAHGGKKILLIDANLHAPFQDQIWFLPPEQGFGNLIIGHADTESVVYPVMPSLDVMPAGGFADDAAACLETPAVQQLIQHIALQYDHIFIDAPPLEMAADAAILSRISDYTMLVVRPGHVTQEKLTLSKSLLEGLGQPSVGLIINGERSGKIFAGTVYDNELLERTKLSTRIPPAESPSPFSNGHLPLIKSASMELGPPSPDKAMPISYDINPESLRHLGASDLEKTVAKLRDQWQTSSGFIAEQEKELSIQAGEVEKIQVKLLNAQTKAAPRNDFDSLYLELRLADEKERMRLLNEALIGQRKRLENQKQLLQYCLKLLLQKQSELETIDTPPVPETDVEERVKNLNLI